MLVGFLGPRGDEAATSFSNDGMSCMKQGKNTQLADKRREAEGTDQSASKCPSRGKHFDIPLSNGFGAVKKLRGAEPPRAAVPSRVPGTFRAVFLVPLLP